MPAHHPGETTTDHPTAGRPATGGRASDPVTADGRVTAPGTTDRLAEALRVTAGRAARTACFFDFDGTLAPIHDDPEAVYPVPGAPEALAVLARLVRRVVIVSARPVAFLRDRLPDLPDAAVYGLYGLEWQVGRGPVHTHPDAAEYQSVMAELASRARHELPPGAAVEYKRLAVSLHYRAVPQLRDAVEAWAGRYAAEAGLRIQAGRMVVELKPPGGRDKGSVVADQLAGVDCAWYFGDDLSDLRGYAALDDRERADPGFRGVRVAVANPESGAALLPAADLCVATPEEVPGLLTRLTAAIDGDGAAGRP